MAVQRLAVLAAVEKSRKEAEAKRQERLRKEQEAQRHVKEANAAQEAKAYNEDLRGQLLQTIKSGDDLRAAGLVGKIDPGELSVGDEDGLNPLHLAAMRCMAKCVETIIAKKGVNKKAVFGPDKRGQTPLHRAAACDTEGGIVEMLAAPGVCALFARDDDGKTALAIAQQWGLMETATIIMEAIQAEREERLASAQSVKEGEAEAEPGAVDFSAEAGVKAIAEGRMDDALKLVVNKLWRFVNDRGPKQRTLLHMAAAKGHVELCQAVLERDDFNLADAIEKERATALHLATAGKFVECVDAIVQSGRFGNVNARDIRGQTALHLAALRADIECYEAIMAHPECQDATPDHMGKSAPEYAVERGLEVKVPDQAADEIDL